MKRSGRVTALISLCLSICISVAALATLRYVIMMLPPPMPTAVRITQGDLAEVIRKVETYGISSEVEPALSLVARRFTAAAVYVVDVRLGRVELAYPPEMVGIDTRDIDRTLRKIHGNRFGNYTVPQTAPATAPDGTRYVVSAIGTARAPGLLVALLYTFYGGLILGWLSMAAWVYLDARHAGGAAVGWGLLTLLSGPLALAVWLIYRRTHQGRPGPACAACGKDQEPHALYCPHCGHPTRPACPECHRPVESEWTYCAACGTDLVGEAPVGG